MDKAGKSNKVRPGHTYLYGFCGPPTQLLPEGRAVQSQSSNSGLRALTGAAEYVRMKVRCRHGLSLGPISAKDAGQICILEHTGKETEDAQVCENRAVGVSHIACGPGCAPCLTGDLDWDCEVGFGDVLSLADQWLAPAGSPADIVGGDGVDIADFAKLASKER